ncbi:NACHT domain-containing protein [Cladophialophora immunda]|nr:NACHT domain-containing protein [Cladophialophora immunda]
MDPITALSLACNVIQLVECSIETVQVCKELYHNGSIDEHNRIEKYTADITATNKDLQAALGTGAPASRPLKIERAAQDALATANELRIILNRLKLSKSQGIRRLGGAFKSTLKTLISSGKIKALQEKLEKQDAALRSSLLKDLYIKAGRSDLAWQKDFQSLSQGQKDIIIQTLEACRLLSTEISTSIRSAEARITDRLSVQDAKLENSVRQQNLQLEILRDEEFALRRRRLLKALVFPEINERRNMIEGRIDDFGDTYKWIFKDKPSASNDVLEPQSDLDPPLDPSMNLNPFPPDSHSDGGDGDLEVGANSQETGSSDLEAVPPAQASEVRSLQSSEERLADSKPTLYAEQTEPLSAIPRPAHAFANWLENGTGLFWISGKPGSGKSTLMDYIYHKIQPEEIGSAMVRAWAGGCPVVILTFWFFRPASTPLLKSLQGFWRSLCFQILDSDTKLAKMIREDEDGNVPPALKSCLLPGGSSAESWTDNELQTWFWYMVTHSTLRYFLLVDGLDEIEDGRELLLNTVLKMSAMSPKLKVCCAGRPENPFQSTLKHHPNLRLQDFNHADIAEDCKRRLGGRKAEKFANQIAWRAEGVFLWAHIISKDLARAAKEGESEEDLDLRLKDCPTEMTEMFKYMLLKQDKLYATRPKPYLQLVDFASRIEETTTVLELLIATLPPARSPKWSQLCGKFDIEFLSYLEEQLDGLGPRIEATCVGLVQCHLRPFQHKYGIPMESHPIFPRLAESMRTEVQFIHRSVHDFLREDQGGAAYYQRFSLTDDEAASMLMAGAVSPLFFSSEKLRFSYFVHTPLYYAESVSKDGWVSETTAILDAFFRQLEVRYLPTQEDEAISEVFLDVTLPDLSLLENLVFGFASKHSLDTYVQAKMMEADPSRRHSLAAQALCTYLRADRIQFRGEMVTNLSPYLDAFQVYQILYRAITSRFTYSIDWPPEVKSTGYFFDHVVAAWVLGISRRLDKELAFLRLPSEFLNPHAGLEVEFSFVEVWISSTYDGRVDDVVPTPDVDSPYMKRLFKDTAVAVSHIQPQNILRTDIFPLKIVKWSPAGTTRFFPFDETLQQRFCVAHSKESWDALRQDFSVAAAEGLNSSVGDMSKMELEEIELRNKGFLFVDEDNKFKIDARSVFILGEIGGFWHPK